MNATSVDVAEMLEADSSLGLVVADNLFIGKEPTRPNNTVTVYDTFGYVPQLTMEGQGTAYEYPSVQIRVRNLDYRIGYNLIQKITQSLHGRANESWGGVLYTVIYCNGGPALLDWDDNGMVRFIVNFNLQRR